MSRPAAADFTVAVVGAGAMGAGIAQVAAQAGHPVLLFDAREGAASRGRDGVLVGLDRLVARGRLTPDARAGVADRLTVVTALEEIRPARLVIEAVVEDLAVKRTLFATLEAIVAPTAILASNTSSLSLTAIAAGLEAPGRVAGLHFFNPAPVMALVEVIAGLATEDRVVDELVALAGAWGKRPVRAKSTPGFIVNRVARPFYAEALRLLEEGAADAPTLDAVMREAGGFRMGPFELMDLIGHDVNAAVTRSVFDAYFGDPRFRPSLVQQELVQANWLGRKTGRGFYAYGDAAPARTGASLPAGPVPAAVEIEGDLGPAEALVPVLEAAGLPMTRRPGEGLIRLAGASLALTDGRTATARAAAGAPADLVLFDLALNFAAAPRIAIAAADQAPNGALAVAAGFFQVLGKQVSAVDDAPGMVVMRTVAMLANEAAEAVLQQIASEADVDTAMTYGVNYPKGPFAWADAVGASRILQVLVSLQDAYGDDRYRASALLRRRAAAGRPLSPVTQPSP